MNNTRYLILPINDLMDKNLSLLEVALLSQLAYMKKTLNASLFASNAYFSKLLNVSPRSIQRAISNLSNNNYIIYTVKNNNKRYIELTDKCNSLYKELYRNNEYDKIIINNDVEISPHLKSFLES